jgi:two-component system, NarL family, sensor kinase
MAEQVSLSTEPAGDVPGDGGPRRRSMPGLRGRLQAVPSRAREAGVAGPPGPRGVQAAMTLVWAREEERGRLGRELHDGVGAALAAAVMTVGAARAGAGSGARGLLESLERDLLEVGRELRLVIDGLRPPALDELGLAGALRRHAARLAAGAGPRVTVREDPVVAAEPPPAWVELAAYRIACEALTNAARHARATRCEVTLARQGGVLRLTVCDDGVGLPAVRRDGVGLAAMRARAAELGGRCDWHPRPGGGTMVDCRLPLGER